MRLRVIGLVYRKEMRETLRDRRTLFIMIVWETHWSKTNGQVM